MIVDPSIPQPQPLPAMGVRSSSDIVDHLDRVLKSQPPEVQAAVDHAHGIMGMNPPSGTATAAPESSAAPSLPASAPIDTPPSINSSGPDPALIARPSISMSPSDAQPLPRPIATATPNPHMENLERMAKDGPGVNKIHNPFLRGLGHVADVIGSRFAPGITEMIPGTTAYQHQQIKQEENQLGNEQKAAKSTADVAHTEAETAGLPAQQELQRAEAQHYISEADALKNPLLKPLTEPVIDPNDPTKTPRIGYSDEHDKTGKVIYGPAVGAKPVAQPEKTPSYHVQPDGSIVSLHYEPATGKTESSVVYKGDPKVESDLTDLEIDGKPHKVIVNKQTGAVIRDLGASGIKPPVTNLNQGTWSIQEDSEGKPIEYSSKTGETRAVAAGGVQKSGTKEKADAKLAPGKDALAYADQYLNSGKFTGSGDEALLEKFFELAKPSSGFRMSQPQIDLLQKSRGYLGSVRAIAHHGLTGTWFDDQQRKEIVDTMKQIVSSKGASVGSGQQGTIHYVDNGVDYDIPHDKAQSFELAHKTAKKQ